MYLYVVRVTNARNYGVHYYTDPGKADLSAAGLHQAAGSSEHQGGMMAGHQASSDGGILGWW